MVKPEVKLLKINDIKEIKDETYREYLYSLEEKYIYYLYILVNTLWEYVTLKK